jgi:hypothetical protein
MDRHQVDPDEEPNGPTPVTDLSYNRRSEGQNLSKNFA